MVCGAWEEKKTARLLVASRKEIEVALLVLPAQHACAWEEKEKASGRQADLMT